MLGDRISRNRELFSLLFVIGFSLISLIWNGNVFSKGVFRFQKLGDLVSGSLDGVGGFFSRTFNAFRSYETVKQERDSCLAVLEDYKTLPEDLEMLRNENAKLREMLSLPKNPELKSVVAEVVSVRLHTIYRTIIVNKGEDFGIRPYMPVVSRTVNEKGEMVEALVGKTIAVTGGSTVIQPLINSKFRMGVSMPGTNLWASLSGDSGRGTEAVLEYIDNGIVIDPKIFGVNVQIGPNPPPNKNFTVSEALSKIGKSVYTSGGSGVFVEGIPVGVIIEEGPRSGAFKTAYLKPFVEFEKLQSVRILLRSPSVWAEKWPEEKTITVENPYFGELNFPNEKEVPKNQNPNPFQAPNPKPNLNLSPSQNPNGGRQPNNGPGADPTLKPEQPLNNTSPGGTTDDP